MKVRNITIVLLVLFFLVGIIAYPYLPARIATHWNESGYGDSYSTKNIGIFGLPVIALALYLLFMLLPKIDPLKKNIKKFMTYYEYFIFVFIIFLFYVYILAIIWNMKLRFDFNLALVPALGLLFIFIGSVLPKLKRNWFIGIRTPWTMSDDIVWENTHKLGSKLFMITGIIIMIGLLFENQLMWFILVPIGALVVWLFVYSYLDYSRRHKNRSS